MILMIIFSMLFLHIIADFLVQNEFMAKFKQKKEWDRYFHDDKMSDNLVCPNKYKHDYIPVLFVHAFSWAFITYLPLLYYKCYWYYVWLILIQTLIHAYVDDTKCNKLKINLITDQTIHLLQIIISFIICKIFI